VHLKKELKKKMLQQRAITISAMHKKYPALERQNRIANLGKQKIEFVLFLL